MGRREVERANTWSQQLVKTWDVWSTRDTISFLRGLRVKAVHFSWECVMFGFKAGQVHQQGRVNVFKRKKKACKQTLAEFKADNRRWLAQTGLNQSRPATSSGFWIFSSLSLLI